MPQVAIDETPKVSGMAGFDRNWRTRKESRNNYWTRGAPANQMQVAFRKEWELFREILGATVAGRCPEGGCGRGSISSYFAAAGFECTLLDYSRSVLGTASGIFQVNGHRAGFVCGDANRLPQRK